MAKRGWEAVFALAALTVAQNAWPAEGGRIDWRGLAAQGLAPPGLNAKLTADLVVALRQLGLRLSANAPVAAEVSASCVFPGTRKVARCTVEADGVGPNARRIVRREEIPYKDGEGLAGNLVLLISDALVAGLELDPVGPSVAAPAAPVVPVEPVEQPDAGVEPPPEPPPAAPANPAPPVEAPAPRSPAAEVLPIPPARWTLDADVAGAFDARGGPALYGASVEALFKPSSSLRLGLGAAVETGSSSAEGFNLSFYRLVAGPSLGAGARWTLGSLDATLGPSLVMHWTNPHLSGGQHLMTTGALVASLRAGLPVTGSWSADLGIACVAALAREQVLTPDGQVLASFGAISFLVTAGVSYRL